MSNAAFNVRNRHFDKLVSNHDLKWLGQNTNHFSPHPSVIEAMHASIAAEEFHIYAPPAGLEELRALIVEDLDLKDMQALVSDGAVASLYHVCHTFLAAGDEFITTDPTWNWPMRFAESVGATVKQIPIYGDEYSYRLAPERLAAAMTDKTRVIYLVDPNNPIGSCCTEDEIREIARIAGEAGAILIHDATYRHFAFDHTLAARFYPEGTITIYSFSKWLGMAGARVGAVVACEDIVAKLAVSPPNNLGSNIMSQRAAIAGLKSRLEWFPSVLSQTRANQEIVKVAVDAVEGLRIPVYPSNGNFLVIECDEAGLTPAGLVEAYRQEGIMVRQGAYHTVTFGDRFIKVSVSVPEEWVREFADLLPEMVIRASTSKTTATAF